MCPLCYGAAGFLAALLLGPLGVKYARRDGIICGYVVFVVPTASLQGLAYLGKSLGWFLLPVGFTPLVPAPLYSIAGLLVVFRLYRAFLQGRAESAASAAKKAAEAEV